MNTTVEEGAWLEGANQRHLLRGNCSLGRSSDSTIKLQSPKASRRHALIHLQNVGEFWLIDLGSANGTFLNSRRLHQPVRLRDHDRISIAEAELTFRQPADPSVKYETTVAQRTVQEVEDMPCWLLLADIENFTSLCRSIVSERLAQLLGGWLANCKEVIERHDGTINKYLGDGFLAYWRDQAGVEENIVKAVAALKDLQKQREPKFRFVLHVGSVAMGGILSMGEESLMGREVNLVFRLEKLAASLGEQCSLSDRANQRLQGHLPARRLGEYDLKGFEGKHPFFAA